MKDIQFGKNKMYFCHILVLSIIIYIVFIMIDAFIKYFNTKTLTIKYRFSPNWTFSKEKFEHDGSLSHMVTQVSQICPIFINDENKPIGNVVINGELFESPDKKKLYLYKAYHTYILPDGTINAIYNFVTPTNVKGGDNTIFSSNTTLKTSIDAGGSGKFALSSGKVFLKTDNTFIRTVTFQYI